jgi:hypothetical protein
MVLPLSPFRTGARRRHSHDARRGETVAAPPLIRTRTARAKIDGAR